jgi:tetratricopeptide (TPR) repeat protein/tRNA A-37 threonylcarbamoyl transferase component Bud32
VAASPDDIDKATVPAAGSTLASTLVSGEGLGVLARGTSVGRYLVVGFLGEGGMATVYSAYDPELDRKVAIKVLRRTAADLEVDRGRLQREAQAMARLSHPNVVPVYDVGLWQGQLFVAMEFVAGSTLRDWLLLETRERDEVVALFLEAGTGLAEAHGAGLVHRDFKPENVLVGQDGRVRVSDFGLAHVEPQTSPLPDSSPVRSSSKTIAGATFGTPAYMAPEQFLGGATDPRTDQFCFCASLWEALCGELPFGGEDFESIRRGVLGGRLRPPARALPGWLVKPLQKGLSARPEDRFQSMPALLAELRHGRRRSARRLITVALALAICAVLAGLGYRQYLHATQCARDTEAERGRLLGNDERAQIARSADGPAEIEELEDKLARWATHQRAACEAADRGLPNASSALACLDSYRIRAAVAVQMLADPKSTGDARAMLLDGLGSPDHCPLGSVAAAHAPTPIRFRQEAAKLEALNEVGRAAEAAKTAPALIAQATSQGAWEAVALLEQQLGEALRLSANSDPQAVEHLRRAVRAADTSGSDELSLTMRLYLASTLAIQFGRPAEADVLSLDAEAWLRRLGTPAHLELQYVLGRATVLRALGRLDDSIALFRRAAELCELTQAPPPEVVEVHNNLSIALRTVGRLAESERELKLAIATSNKARWRTVLGHATVLTNLGSLRSQLGRSADALSSLDEAKALLANQQESTEPYLLWIDSYRGEALEDLGRLDDADAVYRGLLQRRERLDAGSLARALSGHARALLAQHDAKSALALAEEASSLFDQPMVGAQSIALARFTLARALVAAGGDAQRAVALARQALEANAGPEDGFRRAPMEAWLKSAPTAAGR